MSKPQLPDFDTMKVVMLNNFASDCGYNFPLASRKLSSDNKYLLDTYNYMPEMAKIRLAWSLIRCGVEYSNGMFYWYNGSNTLVADLPTMMDIILSPITAPKEQ